LLDLISLLWKHLVRFVMADEEDVCVKIRQRCVIECCVNLGKSGNETLEMLRQAYGGEALSSAAVFQWWRHFKDSNTRVIDKARSGRPSTAVTDVSIAKAAELLGKWPKANVTRTFGFTEYLLRTHWTHCDGDTADASSCVCQVGTQESHRRADATTSSRVHEHCSDVWDNSEFLNLDCDVWRIVDSSFWLIIKTTVKCVETLEFATTQKIPFISADKVMLLLFFDAHGMILQH